MTTHVETYQRTVRDHRTGRKRTVDYPVQVTMVGDPDLPLISVRCGYVDDDSREGRDRMVAVTRYYQSPDKEIP